MVGRVTSLMDENGQGKQFRDNLAGSNAWAGSGEMREKEGRDGRNPGWPDLNSGEFRSQG